MDFGIGLPTGGPAMSAAAIARTAEEAERLGLGAVWTFERLLYPPEPMMLGVGPMPLPDSNQAVWDPLEVLSFVAARTGRIRLGTSVLNGLVHSPVVLAKRLATLDRLSGGRLLAGLGIGWMEQEHAATGVPVEGRGALFDEHLAVMRAVWGPDPVSVDTERYRIDAASAGPKPVRPGGPELLLGAGAPVGLRRAARLGAGLTTVLFDWDALAGTLSAYRAAAEEAGHDPAALPVVVHLNGTAGAAVPDEARFPLTGTVEQILPELDRLRELGVAHVFWIDPGGDPAAQLDGLARLHERAG